MKKQTMFQKGIASVAALTLACSMVAVAPASALAAEKKSAKKPPATKITKLTRTQTTLTVKWKKVSAKKADGYEVRYATNAKMSKAKTQKVTKAKTASVTIKKKIKPATTYYVQVRTYKKVGKKTQYSAWSATKSITTRVKTGDKKLDKNINNILDKKIKKTGEAGLKKAFDYVANLEYKSAKTSIKGKWTKWSVSAASKMIKNEGGNCYEAASLFCWLAKGLGYDAKVVTGSLITQTKEQPHGWVEIKVDGKNYVCDPNLENTYRRNDSALRKNLESFGKNSNLFMETYGNVFYKYKK
ncbi:MAG: transglutaminase domain-containing protein [Adlercreutzia sp.]|nr:transglutaminase domain-containing protein [Adlercreutzia sp.]